MTDFLLEEALRYLGAARADEATRRAVAETAQTLRETISPRFVYRVFDLEKKGGAPFLPDAGLTLPGKLARRMLEGCGKAALLICTLGAGFDARMRHMQARDMAGAVILDACGSAWVEAGCREAEKAVAVRHPGWFLTDRFSPGYGDLPLTLQPDWLRILDAEKRLGVQAAESCQLIPAKTVTAVIGLSRQPQPARIRGCAYCALKNTCTARERGICRAT